MALSEQDRRAARMWYRRGIRALREMGLASRSWRRFRWEWLTAVRSADLVRRLEDVDAASDWRVDAENRVDRCFRKLTRLGARGLARRLEARWRVGLDREFADGPKFVACSDTLASTN